MKNLLGRLSETERDVMQLIWEQDGPVTVASLLEKFKKDKSWKTSTLSTILTRLIEKGYLSKSLSGKTNLYTPTLSLEAYKEYETQSFLSRMHNGSIKNFMASLVGSKTISQQELKELKDWFLEQEGE